MKSVIYSRERCLSCHSCELACAVEHSVSKSLMTALNEPVKSVSRIFIENNNHSPFSLPLKCSHCNPAPCVSACPSGAIKRDNYSETIQIDNARCIGCRNCLLNCPFGVLTFKPDNCNHSLKIIPIKCNECIHKSGNDSIPSCVEACKTSALQYCEINDEMRKRRKNLLNYQQPEASPIPGNIATFYELKSRYL
jgi:anaerobic carbon-monoxide dehydrogenase iron sulfur subunit